jgi:hypothetical protein
MNTDKSVQAIFSPIASNVNINIDTTKGSVISGEGLIHCDDSVTSNCIAAYNGGDVVSLTANPKLGYSFVRWEEGGVSISTEPTLTFTMGGGRCLVGVFEGFELKFPLPGGKHWKLNVQTGGALDCSLGAGIDPYHTGSGYFSLDFDDISEKSGQQIDVPILAAANGTVSFAGGDPNVGYGYNIVIDHGNGYKTRYAHLKDYPIVSGIITQGQQIGIMGSTGNSTGTHLHFQIYYNDSSTADIVELKSVLMENLQLEDYSVGCSSDNPPTGFYYSSNLQ